MNLQEATKSGKRFKPTKESCEEWMPNEPKDKSWLEFTGGYIMDSSGETRALHLVWFDWDWVLEPVQPVAQPQYADSIDELNGTMNNLIKRVMVLESSNLKILNKIKLSKIYVDESRPIDYSKDPKANLIFGGK